jgi:hypothetical protein
MNLGRLTGVALVLAVVALVSPVVAHAQQPQPPLVELLPSLVDGAAAADFNQAIVSQLSTFPLGSSAGGFTFTFDPSVQTFMRTSDSFGPSFAERAMTMGAGTFNIGATYQRSTYDRVEGQDLHNGEIRFFVTDTPSPGDVVSADLAVDLTTDILVWFMSFGLTDRLDVGTMVPFIRVGLDASVTPTLIRNAAGSIARGQGMPLDVVSRTGSASGVGDVVVRTKYNFLKRTGGGLAAVLDVTLPTGDSDNLLGTGAARGKLLFVASTTVGRVAPHVNAGYTVVGPSANARLETDDEYHYVAGIEAEMTDRLTVSLDFIARTLTNVGRLRLGETSVSGQPQGGDSIKQLNREAGDLNLRTGAFGVKWNVGRTTLLTASVLFPLSDAGLVDNLTWSIGFDWTR